MKKIIPVNIKVPEQHHRYLRKASYEAYTTMTDYFLKLLEEDARKRGKKLER